MGNSKWQKQPRLQGHWQALGEVQIYRILANRAIIKCIFHTNRKGGFYGFFHIPNYTMRMNLSPNWAYFPVDLHTWFLVYLFLHQPLPYSPAQGMQTNVPFRTRALCSATISPQLAH